jgi:hypothetical protein
MFLHARQAVLSDMTNIITLHQSAADKSAANKVWYSLNSVQGGGVPSEQKTASA